VSHNQSPSTAPIQNLIIQAMINKLQNTFTAFRQIDHV
jgi:hypothetical protein